MEEKKILESWKEISVYLGRSEKTCRRFEKELGLPVHRLEDSPKARVFAYKEEIDRWIKETQHSEKDIPIEKPFLKKFYLIGVIVISIAITVLIIWQLLLQKEGKSIIPASPKKASLAVLYFKNSTGDLSLDIWQRALAESLILDLHQSRHINVLRADRIFSILRKLDLLDASSYDTEELLQIAAEGQVDYLLLGSFTRAGAMSHAQSAAVTPSGKRTPWTPSCAPPGTTCAISARILIRVRLIQLNMITGCRLTFTPAASSMPPCT